MNKQCNECCAVYAPDWDYCPLCGSDDESEAFDLKEEISNEIIMDKFGGDQ